MATLGNRSRSVELTQRPMCTSARPGQQGGRGARVAAGRPERTLTFLQKNDIAPNSSPVPRAYNGRKSECSELPDGAVPAKREPLRSCRRLSHDPGMSLASELLALILLTAAAPGPRACTPDPPGASSQSGAEAYIRGAEADWAASVANGDEAAFLQRVTAGDFMSVLEGKVLSRPALIAEAAKRRKGAASDRLEDVRVHVSGSTAVAEGVELWTDKAPLIRTRLVWSDIWVHCGGTWRLVTSTSVGRPAD